MSSSELPMVNLQTFLDHPEQLASASREMQLAITNLLNTPRNLLEILVHSQDFQVAQTARLHINWLGEVGENWQEMLDLELQNAPLEYNDRLAVELIKIAPVPDYFLSQWVPTEHLIAGLNNPYLPSSYRLKLLARLAQRPDLDARLQVAESPETPLEILQELAGDLEVAVRSTVKLNINCPRELIKLIESQQELAQDWNNNAEQLSELAESRWSWIRLTVAQNPNTPTETLQQLAKDPVLKIQLAVSKNPHTPAEILAELAQHSDNSIQEMVAIHPHVTEEILHQLFPEHHDCIKKNQNLPASILERYLQIADPNQPLWKQYSLRHFFLQQPNTPSEILAQLATLDLEELIATIPDPEILGRSLQDSLRFLVDIVKHPQVSVALLEQLAEYPSDETQLAIAQHPLTPEPLKLRLFSELAMNAGERVKIQVAADPNTPVSILQAMAEQEYLQTKLLREVRRILESNYPVNAISFRTTADLMMSNLKHNILNPAQIEINSDRWLEVMQTLGIFQQINPDEDDILIDDQDEIENAEISNLWRELLPGLSAEQLRQTIAQILDIFVMIGSELRNSQYFRTVAIALIGNPSTPVTSREQLTAQFMNPNEPITRRSENQDLWLALAYNSALPDFERQQYFQQLLSFSSYTQETVAKNPQTPPEILAQLMANSGASRQAIARNPKAPVEMLAELAQDSNPTTRNWVAENPATPEEVLLQMFRQPAEKTLNNVPTVQETILRNPKFPALARYRFFLEKEQEQEYSQASQLLLKRPNNSYGLLEVVKKGNTQARIQAARNLKMPTHLLAELAKDAEEVVRNVVAKNPNVSLQTLTELAHDPSSSVRGVLASRTKNETLPRAVWEILARDPDVNVRIAVAQNPNTPNDLLEELASDSEYNVKSWLVTNPNLPVTAIERLELESGIVNARNPHTPGYILAHAVNRICDSGRRGGNWGSADMLEKLIKHPVKDSQMPAETLEQLASHHNNSVRYRVAQHPNTPVSALWKLADSDYFPTRNALITNPNSPIEILVHIFNTENPSSQFYDTICHNLAQCVNLPVEIITRLASHPSEQIRRLIALKPHTPPEVLIEFARSEQDINVLQSLAFNPSLPETALQLLATHSQPQIRLSLARHPQMSSQLWQQLAQDSETMVRIAIASSIHCPSEILTTLAPDLVAEVRQKVAANPNTDVSCLEAMISDSAAEVRAAIATNPHATPTLLERLAQDEKIEVRRAVADNNNTPEFIRQTLQEFFNQSVISQVGITLRGLSRIYRPNQDDLPTLLSEYARSSHPFVRFITLSHPLTPVTCLQQYLNSSSWVERYAIAENPATPLEFRQQLTEDSNYFVRATALSR